MLEIPHLALRLFARLEQAAVLLSNARAAEDVAYSERVCPFRVEPAIRRVKVGRMFLAVRIIHQRRKNAAVTALVLYN